MILIKKPAATGGMKMNTSERVFYVLKKNLNKQETIALNSHLKRDLMIDSLDTLLIISALENEFSIQINEEDFKDIETVHDIIFKLETYIKEI